MSTIYQHPDGASIDLTGTTLTVTDADDNATSVQIGQDDLRDLAERFKAHANVFDSVMALTNNKVVL